jgi:ATP-dependent exoDNAse (exonuclease V) beta subunit
VSLSDAAFRKRALTDLDANLLVEAAAGTGKTSIIAGRVAMLLASGRLPSAIAAITFTEFAAGELSVRIRLLVEELLAGKVPSVLEVALPNGLSPRQREALEWAATTLDELTATTIHGFCQRIIEAYAVEADQDPGAAVMDATQADVMFDGVFVRWLRHRLSAIDDATNPAAVLAADDPLGVVDTLRELANLRRAYPTARAPTPDRAARPDIDFVQAVDDFARWFSSTPGEAKTARIVQQLQVLATYFSDSLSAYPDFTALWQLAKLPRQPLMKNGRLEWRAYSCKAAWQTTVKGKRGLALNEVAEAHYARCRQAFSNLMGWIGGALVAQLSTELENVISDYQVEKRAAAVLDFNDLLMRARDLVRRHEKVRQALGRRYRHILLDEFQDTDPVQAEIIFNIAANSRPESWSNAILRPGSLFLVGDPKQAIYRFRGADIGAYSIVRQGFERTNRGNVVQITANFRSAPGILDHVNQRFQEPLSKQGQPGYVALSPTIEAFPDKIPSVAKVSISVPPDSAAATLRDEEASAIADLCRRLVGSVEIRRADGSKSALRPGDIALLAPTGTDLWRYERALESVELSVASQAGRALMLRQETQDLLALVRTLADPNDTLAFGALMRGPLVGLTEAQLLAITHGLSQRADGGPVDFTLRTLPTFIADPIAREVCEVLQHLWRRAPMLTPFALLSEGLERLKVRVVLALRTRNKNARALANVDAVLQMAKPYGVRGLAAFAADLQAAWERKASAPEGRSDEGQDAVALVTVHSSKGLEWPVVIPINTGTRLRRPDQFVYRPSDETLHWVIGGVAPPDLERAQVEEARNAALERERLWYVACTRARNLLVLPHILHADATTWSRVLDLGQETLPELNVGALPASSRIADRSQSNTQTAELFAEEARRVVDAAPALVWHRPSEHDRDRVSHLEVVEDDAEEVEVPELAGGGRLRGVLLHKLMEELIGGELAEDASTVEARAAVLQQQLGSLEPAESNYLPVAAECAKTALATLALPAIAALRSSLMAEVAVFGRGPGNALLAGRADAVAIESGRVDLVIDWKSDVKPTAAEHARYVVQLADYLSVTGAPKGAIVYMTRGEIVWVTPQM